MDGGESAGRDVVNANLGGCAEAFELRSRRLIKSVKEPQRLGDHLALIPIKTGLDLLTDEVFQLGR